MMEGFNSHVGNVERGLSQPRLGFISQRGKALAAGKRDFISQTVGGDFISQGGWGFISQRGWGAGGLYQPGGKGLYQPQE